MPFKACWIAKDKSFTGVGPILGEVENEIFSPFLKKAALKRIKRANRMGKRAKHYLMEVYFLRSDIEELKRVHKPFSEVIDLSPSPPDTSTVLAFYDKEGYELKEDPIFIPESRKGDAIAEPDPLDSIDSDWDIDDEEEDYLEEERKKKEIDDSLMPKFK